MTSSLPRFTMVSLLVAAAAALPRPAHAESGVPCTTSVFQPAPGSTIPANLPAIVIRLSGASFNLADAQLALTDGGGTPVPFTAEGPGPRYVLRLAGPLKAGTLRLGHTMPCGPNRFRSEVVWTVGPAVPFPRNLGTITVGPPQIIQAASDRVYLDLTLVPAPDFVPFAEIARYHLTARRAGVVFWEWKDQAGMIGGPWGLGAVSFECTTAADSGEREIEVRATVAGASDADQAGLVARSSFTVTCPRPNLGDGGPPEEEWDGGGKSGPPDTAPPVVSPPDAGADSAAVVLPLPPPPDAAPDAPAAGSSSSGCTTAPSGSAPWWTALVALAALLRLRRARR